MCVCVCLYSMSILFALKSANWTLVLDYASFVCKLSSRRLFGVIRDHADLAGVSVPLEPWRVLTSLQPGSL